MLYLIAELILCSTVTPPFIDWYYEGRMLNGSYTYSLNDLVTVLTLLKSYIMIRLYYHYSRWTTPLAEDLCKK